MIQNHHRRSQSPIINRTTCNLKFQNLFSVMSFSLIMSGLCTWQISCLKLTKYHLDYPIQVILSANFRHQCLKHSLGEPFTYIHTQLWLQTTPQWTPVLSCKSHTRSHICHIPQCAYNSCSLSTFNTIHRCVSCFSSFLEWIRVPSRTTRTTYTDTC